MSPNTTFANTEQTRRLQNGEMVRDESSVSENPSGAESCIWVGGRVEE
ncbi:hypothetical protein CSPAE12_06075 [Colletotrichum incanum]|nr:hypothetical protein CSPAE12_06075 [Colletotrichum incanum]